MIQKGIKGIKLEDEIPYMFHIPSTEMSYLISPNTINYAVLFLFCVLFVINLYLIYLIFSLYLFLPQISLHTMPHPLKSKRLTWGNRRQFVHRDNARSGKVPTQRCGYGGGLDKLASITHTYLSVSLSISGISKTSAFTYHTLAFKIYYYQTLRIFLKKKERKKTNLLRGK